MAEEKRAARLLHLGQEHPGALPRSPLVPRPLPGPGQGRALAGEGGAPGPGGDLPGGRGSSRGGGPGPAPDSNPGPAGLCRRPDSRGELCLGRGAAEPRGAGGTALSPPPDKGAAPRAAGAPRVPAGAERGTEGTGMRCPALPARPPAAHHPGTPGR